MYSSYYTQPQVCVSIINHHYDKEVLPFETGRCKHQPYMRVGNVGITENLKVVDMPSARLLYSPRDDFDESSYNFGLYNPHHKVRFIPQSLKINDTKSEEVNYSTPHNKLVTYTIRGICYVGEEIIEIEMNIQS